MVENIETLAWIAPRGGAGIDTVGIEQIQSQNEYIVESSQYLNQDKEIINTEGFDTWVRVVQEQVMPAKETSETGHGDYLIYKHGDNGISGNTVWRRSHKVDSMGITGLWGVAG